MVGQNAKKRVNPSFDYAGSSTWTTLGDVLSQCRVCRCLQTGASSFSRSTTNCVSSILVSSGLCPEVCSIWYQDSPPKDDSVADGQPGNQWKSTRQHITWSSMHSLVDLQATARFHPFMKLVYVMKHKRFCAICAWQHSKTSPWHCRCWQRTEKKFADFEAMKVQWVFSPWNCCHVGLMRWDASRRRFSAISESPGQRATTLGIQRKIQRKIPPPFLLACTSCWLSLADNPTRLCTDRHLTLFLRLGVLTLPLSWRSSRLYHM